MKRRPPRATLVPYTALFRSAISVCQWASIRPGISVRPPPSTTAAPAGGSIGASEIASIDRKSTRLNSSHANISYAAFCLQKKLLLTRPFAHAQHRVYRDDQQ